MKLFLSVLIACLPLFNIQAITVTSQSLDTDVTWQGVVEVNGTVIIEETGKLLIKPGTRINFSTQKGNPGELIVYGSLAAVGKPDNKIIFAAKAERSGFWDKLFGNSPAAKKRNWGGISFINSKSGNEISFAAISQAKVGVNMSNSHVKVSNSEIINNLTGFKIQQRSQGQISNCTINNNENEGILCLQEASPEIINNAFHNNTKTAISCVQATPKKIAGNNFSGNNIGIICNYPGTNPLIYQNEFSGHKETAILVSMSAAPPIKNNIFKNNKIAVRVEKRALSEITGNIFNQNDTAVILNQGASVKVTNNEFQGSRERALFINNSSYPAVNYNNFTENKVDIEAGDHQSTKYEQVLRANQDKREENMASRRNRAPRRFSKTAEDNTLAGFIDARYNYWNENQGQVVNKKDDTNLANIIDFYEVPYRIYDDVEYLQDKVEVLPAALKIIDITLEKP